MILYPALHIKNGIVVRLTRGAGDFEEAEVLDTDPVARALQFQGQKFPWLHVVDLNGAFEGYPVNGTTVENILKNINIPIQLSGGIRDLKTIESWIEKGVARIVLATAAVNDPEMVREACRIFPGKIAVKIDSRNGYIVGTGWKKTSPVKALDVALRAEDSGATALVYADINRDGALGDVNMEAIIDLAYALKIPVIASGGVNSMQDLHALKANTKAGVAGLILGRALYSGRINAEEALALASS